MFHASDFAAPSRRGFVFGAAAGAVAALPAFSAARQLSQDVDGRGDPWNMRPAVSAIMGQANRLAADGPVVVLIGEVHTFQTHTLLQQALLKALHDQPYHPFALGYEKAHTITMPGFMNDPRFREGRYTASKAMFRFCQDKGISVSFNDVAYNIVGSNVIIDQTDDYTRDLIQRRRPDLAGKELMRARAKIFPSAEAMEISNFAMVEKAQSHIVRTGAKIYVQQCGIAHMFGIKEGGQNHPYKSSLAARFAEAGAKVLPVMLSYEDMARVLPPEMPPMDNGIKISRIARGEFGRVPYDSARAAVNRHSNLDL